MFKDEQNRINAVEQLNCKVYIKILKYNKKLKESIK